MVTPDDLARAAADAEADLAALEGVDPGGLEAWIIAQPDPATDGLDCDFGDGLAAELEGNDDG